MCKTHVTISLAIDNLWFGLTNYKNLPISLNHKSWQQFEMPIEYSNLRLLKKLFVRLHLEYSF